MNKIAICIPTYKRPLLLKNLLTSIIESNFDQYLIKCVDIIVVDNDIEKSAELIYGEFENIIKDPFALHYFIHSEKGLANVRNELLRKALNKNPQFILFIDDDEYADSEWMNEMVKTIIINEADMVSGPVISIFEKKTLKYIACWFERSDYPENKELKTIATNNLIIRAASLIKYNIWFDIRFNYTGSEDLYFGVQMAKQGAKSYWAAKAIVYETIPESRTRLKWLIRRFYNAANTYTYILRLEKRKLELLKKISVSIIYIVAGICAFIFIPIPMRKRYWGIIKLSEGIGGISGLLNIKYHEYK